MREIKFRAWDKLKNKILFIDQLEFCRGELKKIICFDGEMMANQPDRYSIMQYTGLKDKNGKDIFEGDIIATTMTGKDRQTMVVEYNHDGYIGLMHPEKRIVIGNIYETNS